ncbi:MAG: N-6 DNA methylase [bacterium]|nr:N-6 DNA methylase [bacterium]
MSTPQSENSYIANEILPLLASGFGYPIHDSVRVKINDVPIFRPSGGRAGTMDIVYYHNGEPVLLVEAKRKHKSHDAALQEALKYLLNFPVKREEFAPSGIPPKFLATTVGKEIKFYKWSYDYSHQIPDFLTEEVEILSFNRLLEYYGLNEKYQARILDVRGFKTDFFDELVAIFKTDAKEERITADIIKKVSLQILNFLAYGDKFAGQLPYTGLSIQGQKAVRDLFDRFNLTSSLGPEAAREFRRAILRSFQGGGFNQYLTEQCVIAFMVGLVGGFRPETTVLDFECGSGGFLAAAVELGVGLENIRGIDIEELPCIVAKTYLALYFKKTGEWIDALPVKKDNGLLDQGSNWDVVIGNPAGGNKYEHGGLVKIGSHLDRDLDRNGRLDDNLSEYNLSIQQAVMSTKIGGKICLILPEGFFSNSQDEFLRKFVAKHCKVLAIVSLPRGVFKKGTSTRRLRGGAQTASMKMSIFCAEKVKEIDKEDLIGTDDSSTVSYPVFLVSVNEPTSTSGSVCDWLEPRLVAVLEQWEVWRSSEHLEAKPITKIAALVSEKRKKHLPAVPLPFAQSPDADTKSARKRAQPKTQTKVNKDLDDIFSQ